MGPLALPEPARAELAAELLASHDVSQMLDEDELRRAWDAELVRRAARLDAGEEQGVPLDAALDQVRANLTV
ncbi:MAG: addiction module protein [Acidimicrobiales bacterium]|nr:addiction module protein [Acidimicrobiales bacterium]